MGLYACKECGRDVSDRAVECQRCGCPTASKGVWRSLSELNTPITFIFLSISLMVLFLLINPEYFFAEKVSERSGKLADLGDFLGGLLNPLLTFISVILLITTLKLTRDSVDISKRELMLSRQAMTESALALKNQAQSLEVQNFNNLFFNLLSYHEASVSSLDFKYTNLNGRQETCGKDCFIKFYELVSYDLTIEMQAYITMNKKIDSLFFETQPEFHQENRYFFDNYILAVQTILITIDNADDYVRKTDYMDILASHLSSEQVLAILYFGAFLDNGKGLVLKQLLIKYDLLRQLKTGDGSLEFFIQELYRP